MTRRLCMFALLLCVSHPVLAQEAGQSGLAIGFPGSIGIIWHTSDAVALRPDFTFSHSSSQNAAIDGLDTTSWTFGAGVSALFYTGTVHENVRTYFSPRFGYSRGNSDNNPGITSVASSSHSNAYQYSGSFGVQYTPVRRFGVYGEAGIQYARSDSEFTSGSGGSLNASGKSTGSGIGTRAGVGLVWYFG